MITGSVENLFIDLKSLSIIVFVIHWPMRVSDTKNIKEVPETF